MSALERVVRRLVAVTLALAVPTAGWASAQAQEPCDGPGPQRAGVERLGAAVEGFGVNSAVLLDRRLHIASMDLSPLRLVAYDPDHARATPTAAIDRSLRAWRMATTGGLLYVGLWDVPAEQSNFVAVDPHTGTVTDLPRLPARMDVTAMTASPDGIVYAATDQPETVFAYDPAAGTLQALPVHDSPDNVVGALAATAEQLYVGMRGDHAALYEIDRATGVQRSLLPTEVRGQPGIGSLVVSDGVVVAGTTGGPAQIVVLQGSETTVVDIPAEVAVETAVVHDGAVWFAGKPSGALYRYDLAARQLRVAARPVPDSPVRHVDVLDGHIIGVSAAETVWIYDAGSGEVERTDLLAAGAPGAPAAVMSLAVASGRVFAAGNNRLQVRSLSTGTVQRITVVGEPKALSPSGREVLMAMYPYAQLRAFDAERSTTRLVASWDLAQNRPRDLDWLDHNRLVIATRADEAGGGALVVHDRSTATTGVHPDPLGPGRAVTTTATQQGITYAGSDGSSATVAAWDAATATLRWSALPAPGGGAITGLVVHGERVWGTTHRGWLFALEHSTGALEHLSRPLTAPAGEIVATDTALYAASSERVVHIDPETGSPAVIADELSAQLFERPRLVADDDCALYTIAGTDVARLRAATTD